MNIPREEEQGREKQDQPGLEFDHQVLPVQGLIVEESHPEDEHEKLNKPDVIQKAEVIILAEHDEIPDARDDLEELVEKQVKPNQNQNEEKKIIRAERLELKKAIKRILNHTSDFELQ